LCKHKVIIYKYIYSPSFYNQGKVKKTKKNLDQKIKEEIIMLKRLISILLCCVLVLGMAACGSSTAPPESTGSLSPSDANRGDTSTLEGWGEVIKSKSNGKKIMVAMASHPSTEAFKTMADEFSKLTGIEVTWDIVEETNLKSKQLLDNQGAGN